MKKTIMLCMLVTLLVGATFSPFKYAQYDMSRLYDSATLTYWSSRYAKSTNALLRIIRDHLPAEQYRRVASVTLDMPLSSSTLLNFYSMPTRARIVMAVSDLKFLDDLCIAYAWLYVNGYRLETIEEYVAVLKYKRASDFPNGRYQPPLTAMRIPANALEDKRVDDLSLRLFNSARTFILAHELGHIYFKHPNSTIGNEEKADAFALEVMRAVKNIPMGMFLFFQATSLWFPNRADFASDQAWEVFLTTKATHPLNARRLTMLAAKLDSQAADFASNERDANAAVDTVHFISNGIRQTADYLDDTEIQRCVAQSVIKLDLASLAPRRRADESQLAC